MITPFTQMTAYASPHSRDVSPIWLWVFPSTDSLSSSPVIPHTPLVPLAGSCARFEDGCYINPSYTWAWPSRVSIRSCARAHRVRLCRCWHHSSLLCRPPHRHLDPPTAPLTCTQSVWRLNLLKRVRLPLSRRPPDHASISLEVGLARTHARASLDELAHLCGLSGEGSTLVTLECRTLARARRLIIRPAEIAARGLRQRRRAGGASIAPRRREHGRRRRRDRPALDSPPGGGQE
mmetsp:Transcript_36635/g.96702  ORF Transcript_36635/g.96702 Transcript_36635/m.96702 type:complete len:235 (+) Transcript_36635:122-826(+)